MQSLKIENIAIIESATIDFDAGLNVMTGETGAGKSIIIDSINAILGDRTSRELIRTGAERAKVSAVFFDVNQSTKSKLEKNAIALQDDGCLILQRTIAPDGRNICTANGEPLTVGMLKDLAGDLINIHGQHDNQALLQSEGHLQFIDALAENEELLQAYSRLYDKKKELEKEELEISTDEAQKARLLDLLNFQITELEEATLIPGEQEELKQKQNLFRNAEKMTQNLNQALHLIAGHDEHEGAMQQLAISAANLEKVAEYYPELDKTTESLHELNFSLEEHTDSIRSILGLLDFNPKDYELIEERLDLIYRLSRKYGDSEEEMLKFLDDALQQREKIIFSDQRLKEIKSELLVIEKKLEEKSNKLSAVRKAAGLDFSNKVKEELAFLDMPNVSFEVDFQSVDYTPKGRDKVEFLISANIGQAPKPLAKIASGGELSRIMLAIKNVLASKDEIDTLIFDEVDAGVSGRAAQKVALKLRQVSKGRQVICVTHLAQIAAQAGNHLLISKAVSDNKTYTKVKPLDFEGRKKEIARIIGGINLTEIQLKSAEELLREAGNK